MLTISRSSARWPSGGSVRLGDQGSWLRWWLLRPCDGILFSTALISVRLHWCSKVLRSGSSGVDGILTRTVLWRRLICFMILPKVLLRSDGFYCSGMELTRAHGVGRLYPWRHFTRCHCCCLFRSIACFLLLMLTTMHVFDIARASSA